MSFASQKTILINRSSESFKLRHHLSNESLKVGNQLNLHKNGLRYFEASLFATVLEDAMCAIKILEECNNCLRVTKTKMNMMNLLARKFAVQQPKEKDELGNVDSNKLHSFEYKLLKLEADRKYLNETLFGTYQDLSLDRCFLYLSEQLQLLVDRTVNLEALADAESRNRLLRRDLHRQLRLKRNHDKSAYYEVDSIISILRTNVEDANLNTKVRNRYVKNWQLARTEQHLQTINNKEVNPLTNIQLYKLKSDQEHRVHSEIELLMNITLNENMQKIEEWMNKYDKDMENIDLKIQKKRNELDDMKNKVEELKQTIDEHARQITSWVTFKEEREKARLYREKMTNAAISIQAWWRGLLVRNQLGPYKVVKKPPPGAGRKKKK